MKMTEKEKSGFAKFKSGYKKIETYADMDKLVEATPVEILNKIKEALQIVSDTTGLTMKDEATLSKLNYM